MAVINMDFSQQPFLPLNLKLFCLVNDIRYVFEFAGVGMMLTTSDLCYNGTIHPLKPAISRPKLRVVCGFSYTVAVS